MNLVNGLVALPSVLCIIIQYSVIIAILVVCRTCVIYEHSKWLSSPTISVSGYSLYSTLLSLAILAVFKTRVTADPAIMVDSVETNLHLQRHLTHATQTFTLD